MKTRWFCAAAVLLLIAALCGCGGRAETKSAQSAGGAVSQVLQQGAASAASAASAPEPAVSAEPSAAAASSAEPAVSASEPAEAASSEAPVVSVPEPAASTAEPPSEAPAASADGVDIDLTQMNATMVYAQVLQLMTEPDAYLGKVFRMRGQSWSTHDETTGLTYYGVIIADATACCAQGVEYALAEGAYPQDEEEVTVVGTFETYDENGMLYCRLGNARREA